MTNFAQDSDLLEYEPQIKDYGVFDFSDLHTKTTDDIVRLLNIRWWNTHQASNTDVTVIGTATKLTKSKLNHNQFTRAAVYHVFAYYIFPRLSTFTEEQDVFERKMNYYKEKFAEEFDLILRDGVHYDADSSGQYEDTEKQSFYHGRLIR